MPQQDQDAIVAFIRAKGVTRCPTACVAPTQAYVSRRDRQTLRERAEEREITWKTGREKRLRKAWLRRIGGKAA